MGKRARGQIKIQNRNNKDSLRKPSRRIIGACGITIFLITMMIYTPALKNSFVWDDNEYVYQNSYIHSLNIHALSLIFAAFHAGNWHPLTWLSHATDYAIWGINPFGHHLTSIILHGMNTFLVFLLVIQLMLKGQTMNKAPSPSSGPCSRPAQPLIAAAVTALLFGIHPLHVESVAWVAERKDVLCAFFFLLTLCSYLFYASSAVTKHQCIWFTACVMLSAAALMAKPMAVTLPLILLLLDIYPLKRITLYPHTNNKNLSLLLEKVPFFFLSLVSSGLTVLAQHAGGAIKSLETLPLQLRLLNALHSPCFYLSKILWPLKLVPFYPFPEAIGFFDLTYCISGMLALSITGGCIWLWKRGRILFLIVWAYYLITLLPVVGIVQVGIQAAADRYTYLPSISIFLVAGIGVAQLFAVLMGRKNIIIPGVVIVVIIFIVLGQLTVNQIKIWQDSETLWRYVIKSFPGRVPFVHNNLGLAYESKGLHDKAAAEYEKALAIDPTYAKACNNLGNIYLEKGEYNKAVEAYEKALASDPNLAEAHTNLGNDYLRKGEYAKAIEAYEKALAINPNLADAHNNLGNAYLEKGEYNKAVEAYEKALAINPNFAEAHNNLGMAYLEKGEYNKAVEAYEKALAINPTYVKACNNLGNAYLKKGEYNKAVEAYEKALAINPTYVKACNNLGNAYLEKGEYNKAVEAYEKALAINPNFAEAHNNLGMAYLKKGEYNKAIEAYKKALAINHDFAEAHNDLARAYYEIRNYKLAADHLGKASLLGYKVDPELLEFIKHNRP